MRLKTYSKIRSGHFLCVLALPFVVCRPVYLFKPLVSFKSTYKKKGLIKKFISGKIW